MHRRRRGGAPPPPPHLPFQCLGLTAKFLLRCQEDLRFKIFGPPSAGAIGAPSEDGGSQPNPPPPPRSNTSLGLPRACVLGKMWTRRHLGPPACHCTCFAAACCGPVSLVHIPRESPLHSLPSASVPGPLHVSRPTPSGGTRTPGMTIAKSVAVARRRGSHPPAQALAAGSFERAGCPCFRRGGLTAGERGPCIPPPTARAHGWAQASARAQCRARTLGFPIGGMSLARAPAAQCSCDARLKRLWPTPTLVTLPVPSLRWPPLIFPTGQHLPHLVPRQIQQVPLGIRV